MFKGLSSYRLILLRSQSPKKNQSDGLYITLKEIISNTKVLQNYSNALNFCGISGKILGRDVWPERENA